MSSESSTDPGRAPRGDAGIQPWHFYLLLSMAAATWAVLVSPHTQPAALALLSGAILAAGLIGASLHQAIAGFFGVRSEDSMSLPQRVREAIEADKALVLRSIKELEFDRAMGKVSDADFAEIGGRLRARAMALIEELDRASAPSAPPRGPAPEPPPAADHDAARAGYCPACGTPRDRDARFCKNCGGKFA